MMNKLWITHFGLRRFLRASLSLVIFASTVSLGTATITRASLSNLPHPCGLSIKSPLDFSHKSGVVNTSDKPVSQTPSEYLRQQQTETVSVSPLSRIESENLFGNIPEQVIRGNANVLNCFNAFTIVHIVGSPTNVGCIGFGSAVEFIRAGTFHCLADSVKHKPSRSLRNADCAAKLVTDRKSVV
jgi:hypothetical protein